MLGFLWLAGFCFAGVLMAEYVLHHQSRLVRLWIGLVAGFVLGMWLPGLCGIVLGFGDAAQWVSLALALVPVGALHIWRPRPAKGAWPEAKEWRLLAFLLVPALLLTVYLQYTHILRPQDGAMYVGQSTYGDLSLHLGIATSLAYQGQFPPQYSLLPDTLLAYPFLVDALSASMLVLGTPLNWAFIVPGTVMMMLVFLGFYLFAHHVLKSRKRAVLAWVFFFFNGGLGFIYMFDLVWQDPSRLLNIFTGFYQTPPNMPELNLRWSNVVVDLLIPQRTLMSGWLVLLPALYLLWQGFAKREKLPFIVAGILAGTLPMIHTHSFFALGLVFFGWTLWSLRFEADRRKDTWRCVLIFGGIVALLAAPQLLYWTFRQSSGEGFMKPYFNWVNLSASGLIDSYFWFWIKNVGPLFILMVPAFLAAKSKMRQLMIGGMVIFVVAECIVFQPNVYDNNKLFYVWYMLLCLLCTDYLATLYHKVKDVGGVRLLAGLFVMICTLSGALSMAREVVSDYQLFSPAQVEMAEYLKKNAPADAVVLTGGQHNNAVAALSGRNIVCGTTSYLYFHGLDYQRYAADAGLMYLAEPEISEALMEKYNVTYVLLSDHELGQYGAGIRALQDRYEQVFQQGSVILLKVNA